MWKSIYNFVLQNWVQWLYMIVVTILGVCYRRVINHQKKEAARNDALCDGVQALLRDRIIQGYNEYSEKGYCPIYAKDNVKRLYKPYTELGVDDVITELVGKLLQMPTEKH